MSIKNETDSTEPSSSNFLQTNRRAFFMKALKASGQIALASAGIYTISLIGPGGKFGGLTAGAKCAPGQTQLGAYCCDSVSCDGWGCWCD